MRPEPVGEAWQLVVAPDWPGFAGHFPGDPILPAAELLEMALHCATERGLSPSGLRKARFLQPVRPGDTLRWELVSGRHGPGLRGTVAGSVACELWLDISADSATTTADRAIGL